MVTRPPRPLPGTSERSTDCSAAIRATTGETKARPPPGPFGTEAAANDSRTPLLPAAASVGVISAIVVPTGTVSPSSLTMRSRIPSAGLGTSVSTLSVEISSSGSSALVASPSLFSHLTIVPSETETPICGMTTSMWV